MDLARNLVTLGRVNRENVSIKVCQPLSEVLVDGRYEDIVGDLIDLIERELNIKEVHYEHDLSQFVSHELKLNFPVTGPKLGRNIRASQNYLAEAKVEDLVDQLGQGPISVTLDSQDYSIKKDNILIRVHSREGFNVSMEGSLLVILDTKLNSDLVLERDMWEFVSKIQRIHKAEDLDVVDYIHLTYGGDPDILKAINYYRDSVRKGVLTSSLTQDKPDGGAIPPSGKDTYTQTKKA